MCMFMLQMLSLSLSLRNVNSQSQLEVGSGIADAVLDVGRRQPGGPEMALLATEPSGLDIETMFIGIQELTAKQRADDPVSIHALFSRNTEAPGTLAVLGTSADIVTKATEIFAFRNGGQLPNITEFKRQIEPYCAVRQPVCNTRLQYRTADGSCNNLRHPLWGAAISPQPRFLPPEFGDVNNIGSIPRVRGASGELLPNPRLISNAVFKGGISLPRSYLYNIALTHFAQFVGHDVISTPILKDAGANIYCCNGDQPVNRPECFSFQTPPGEFVSTCMPFVRSDYGVEPGCPPGPRNPINQQTSFLDLSVIYGNTVKTQNSLREPGTGRLKEGRNRNLPDSFDAGKCKAGETCFKSGDTRAIDVPMLTVFHSMFLREHNNIINGLRHIGWDGERLYQEAKKILTGIYQHIIYSEFLPLVIGQRGVDMYGLGSTFFGHNTVYNDSVNPSTRNVFGAAAFRFGHSIIGHFVESQYKDFSDKAVELLEDHFFSTKALRDTQKFGTEGIARWMTSQFKSRSDRFLSSSVRDALFQTKPGNSFDLGALNIQRGRDHGLPPYNRWREFCGMLPAFHFGTGPLGLSDHDPSSAKALLSVYKEPDDIDLFAGGISERSAPGALVGPTFRCIIGYQFLLLKMGDRFFYENDFFPTGFSKAQLYQIKSQTMSSLYCRTIDIEGMPVNGFISPLSGEPRVPCRYFKRLNLAPWTNPRRYKFPGRLNSTVSAYQDENRKSFP